MINMSQAMASAVDASRSVEVNLGGYIYTLCLFELNDVSIKSSSTFQATLDAAHAAVLRSYDVPLPATLIAHFKNPTAAAKANLPRMIVNDDVLIVEAQPRRFGLPTKRGLDEVFSASKRIQTETNNITETDV